MFVTDCSRQGHGLKKDEICRTPRQVFRRCLHLRCLPWLTLCLDTFILLARCCIFSTRIIKLASRLHATSQDFDLVFLRQQL